MRPRRPRRGPVAVALILGAALLLGSCGDPDGETAAAGFGDASEGERLFIEYGCASCHQISGTRQATGRVGPNLDGLTEQRIIAGVLPNTPGHLAAFIREPGRYASGTGMPDVGVTEEDAEHLVAFLLQER